MSDYDPGFSDVGSDDGWDSDKPLPDGFFDNLGAVSSWRVCVLPVKPKKVSSGGIVIPITAQEAQHHLNYVGRVISMGPMAWTDKRLGARGDGSRADCAPKFGEFVVYGKYSGQRLLYKGVTLLIINDDEVLMSSVDPEALQIKI